MIFRVDDSTEKQLNRTEQAAESRTQAAFLNGVKIWTIG